MDFADDADQAAFRFDLRKWLAENPPGDMPSEHGEEGNRANREWHRQLYQGGWLGLSWPVEYGGKGLSPVYEAILNEEVGRAGDAHVPAYGHLGRAILDFGSEEQKRRFLPPLLSGEVQWCQGFSEPEAGSDLAALRTRAERRGEVYVVNGQKVWTSRAQWADWCLLLCRTNPDLPKHQGLSVLVFEMDRPGITVRPVRQIWGTSEFNEVFFDDLEVPAENLIGQEGDGWRLATATLAAERGPADIGFISRFEKELRALDAHLAGLDEDRRADLAVRVAEAYVQVAACRAVVQQQLSRRAKGEPLGPASSIGKLLMTRAHQTLGKLELEVAGAPALLATDDGEATYLYFRSRAASIYGGTEQIQRDIVAQRILGLPRGGPRPGGPGGKGKS